MKEFEVQIIHLKAVLEKIRGLLTTDLEAALFLNIPLCLNLIDKELNDGKSS